MKSKKYFIGLDVHKKKTIYVVRDRLGNILTDGKTATLYPELYTQLKTYLTGAKIGLEASTCYLYTISRVFEERI